MYKYKLKTTRPFSLLTFKLTASGGIGEHGQHAIRVVAVATKAVKENAMIPLQIMVDQHVLERAKTLALAINRTVQVTNLPMNFCPTKFFRLAFVIE